MTEKQFEFTRSLITFQNFMNFIPIRHITFFFHFRIGFQEDILSPEQKDQYFKKKEKFAFNNLDFSFSDPMAECDDMKYICVRIERGDNPATTGDLGYTLGGFPDSNAQTGCTGAPECRGNSFPVTGAYSFIHSFLIIHFIQFPGT